MEHDDYNLHMRWITAPPHTRTHLNGLILYGCCGKVKPGILVRGGIIPRKDQSEIAGESKNTGFKGMCKINLLQLKNHTQEK